ncbi:hypothetical protein C4D60_Mb04t01370 [Musa balbisiana]|uniref:Glutaredoxin domain-containing protein n=1 Tax=Musa balbisiana TaxID=52838 RepID=A0A4S8K8Y2_MUSBA|nr:hypothetical protein C4D60_Mb04t01370 [Musa balbisiana]
MALVKAKQIVSSNPVVVFSKSYCPYCTSVKQLLTQMGAKYKAIELDVESDGPQIQAALAEWTGQRTVPNVFVGGKHIGGCDSTSLGLSYTMASHGKGELVPLLVDAGAVAPAAYRVV